MIDTRRAAAATRLYRAARSSTIVLMLATMTAPAHAQAPDATARRLYTAGLQAYDAGRYDVAIKAFEAAYARAPSDLLIFDNAQAHRKKYIAGGEVAALDKAIELYRRFLASPATGRERTMAGDTLAELLLLAARRDQGTHPPVPVEPTAKTEIMIVTDSEGARVALDDGRPTPAPLLETVTPGEHHAHVSAPGYASTDLRITAVAGRFVVSEAHLTPLPSAIELNAPSGVFMRLDSHDEGMVPRGPIPVAAGEHRVQLRRPGYMAWQERVDVARGQSVRLRATLVPTARRRAVRWLGLAAGIIGVAAIASAAVWGRADHDAEMIYDRKLTGQITAADVSEYDHLRDVRAQGLTATGVLLSAGGLLATTTLALFLVDRR
jgi:PEGA domain